MIVVASCTPTLEALEASPVVGVGPGETRVEGGRRHILGGRTARRDRIGDTDIVQDLHRPLIQHVRLRQVRRRRAGAHKEVVDAVRREEHRGGQTRATTPYHQNVELLIGIA
jgi:hypothetical protein